MILEIEVSDTEMKLISLAKENNINVSRDALADIGDIFLTNLTL